MSIVKPAEVIAEALAKHQPRQIWPGNSKLVCRHPDCYSCDWTPAHQASVIAAVPDIAIVPVPPMEDGDTLMPPETLKQRMRSDGAMFQVGYQAAIDAAAGGES